MEKKTVRAALIGVGNMGKKYARMIADGAVSGMVLSAVVIRREELLAWGQTLVNQDGTVARIFQSNDALFDAPELYDALIIVTPHKTHAALAIRAFALGKDVLCDKPAAADLGETLAMNEAADKSGRIYGMVFHQRLYPKYRKLKQLIDSGELGSLRRVSLINSRYLRTAHYHHSGSWRSSFSGEGGGALINQGQHILDIFQYLFGMPQRMYALCRFGKYNTFAVDDEDTLLMDYADGMTASFILTTGEACHEERLEIIGTKARVLLEDERMTITRHPDVEEYIRTEPVDSRENMQYDTEVIEFEKAAEPYAELLHRFAQAVQMQDDRYLVARGQEGLHALMLCAGAYESSCSGRQITLPLDAALYQERMKELLKREAKLMEAENSSL